MGLSRPAGWPKVLRLGACDHCGRAMYAPAVTLRSEGVFNYVVHRHCKKGMLGVIEKRSAQ